MAPRKAKTSGNGNGHTTVETIGIVDVKPVTNVNEGLDTILSIIPEKTIQEAASYCEVTENAIELLNWLSNNLSDEPVFMWQTIPSEYEYLLDEFKQLWQAQNSVRKLAPESSTAPLEMSGETLKDMLVNLSDEAQPEAGEIVPMPPSELAQGHAEQEAETVELEALAEELAIGGKLEAIQAGVQDADTLAADYENAFRQRLALRKAEMWAKFGQQQTQARMSATNSNLASPNKAIELRQKLEQQKADFLKKDQAIKTAWENRSVSAE